MANAKNLTKPQIAALRAVAKGDPIPANTVGQRSTRESLKRRGLIEWGDSGERTTSGGVVFRHLLTPTGHYALFVATGCRCDECKLTEGP